MHYLWIQLRPRPGRQAEHALEGLGMGRESALDVLEGDGARLSSQEEPARDLVGAQEHRHQNGGGVLR